MGFFSHILAALKYSVTHPHFDPQGTLQKIGELENHANTILSVLALVPDGNTKTAAVDAVHALAGIAAQGAVVVQAVQSAEGAPAPQEQPAQ